MKRMQQADAESERERSKDSSGPASKRERTSVSSSPTSAASATQSPSSTSSSRERDRTDRDKEDRDRDRERERERERDRLRPVRGVRSRDRRTIDYHYWHYYDSDSEPESNIDKTKRLADQMTVKTGKLNNNQVYKVELQQMPSRLLLVASLPQAAPDVTLSHGWSPTDHSVNVYVREDDPFTFHRQPIAQSTDSIRTKQGYSRGIHVFQIWWSRRQRGTHAVVGVGTQDADTHCIGYQALVGANRESWGWDIGRLRLVHDAQRAASASNGLSQGADAHSHNASARERERERERARSRASHDSHSLSGTDSSDGAEQERDTQTSSRAAEANGNGTTNKPENINVHNKAYPACWTSASISSDTAAVPERFFMVLDCDEGTLSFVANEQFLGVAFRGLRGRTLYPMISAVWGHGEVTMRYYNGIDEPLPLRDLCRYSLRQHFGSDHLGLIEHLPLPKPIIDYLLYRAPAAMPTTHSVVTASANNPPSPSSPFVAHNDDDSNGSSA